MPVPVRAPASAAPTEGYQDGEIEDGEIEDGIGGEDADDAAEQDAGEGEDGEDDGQEEELDPDVAPRRGAAQTRGQTRFQRLANEVADLKRQNDQLRGTRPAPAQPAMAQSQEETETAFRQRISLLSPHEQMMETQSRSEQRMTRFVQMQTLQNQDMLDKAQFDAKAASNPRYKRYAAAVEAKRMELWQLGQTVPREALLKFLLGERLLENDELGRSQGKGKNGQRQAAQRRVAAQQTRPQQTRSDVAPQRGRLTEAQARAKRLEGMNI